VVPSVRYAVSRQFSMVHFVLKQNCFCNFMWITKGWKRFNIQEINLSHSLNVRCEVLTAVRITIGLFWVVTPFSLW
jgi:hypothetical protein